MIAEIGTLVSIATHNKMVIDVIGTAITAFSAIITTGIAVMVFLMNRKSPLVSCVIIDDEHDANLIISNIGNRTAKNVKFKVSGSLANHLKIDISKLNFVALAPGETFTYHIGEWPNFYEHGNELDLHITSYRDSVFGRFLKKTEKYSLSLGPIANSSNITNWNRRFHNEMKEISKNLNNMNRSFDRYRGYIEKENQKKPDRNFSQRIELQRVKRQKRV